MLERYEAAEISLNKAVEIDPNMPQAYQNRAFHYSALNKTDRVIENLRKAIELDPASIEQGILSTHFLDPIRDDEPFKQLVHEYGRV